MVSKIPNSGIQRNVTLPYEVTQHVFKMVKDFRCHIRINYIRDVGVLMFSSFHGRSQCKFLCNM